MGKRMLVVEDDVELQQVMTLILETAGHEVVSAMSGEEALAAASAGSFDLVSLDINLPGKSGLRVAAELRGLKGWESVPIIAVTVHDFGSTDGHVLRHFTGYVQKPIDVEQFLMRIEGYLQEAKPC